LYSSAANEGPFEGSSGARPIMPSRLAKFLALCTTRNLNFLMQFVLVPMQTVSEKSSQARMASPSYKKEVDYNLKDIYSNRDDIFICTTCGCC
jgi:hypothetical protein